MFHKIWDLIKSGKPEMALESLKGLTLENDYLRQVARILEAEALLQNGNFEKCLEVANAAQSFFHHFNQHRKISECANDITGIQIPFLESCLLNWILARALAGLMSWHQSYDAGKHALDSWDFYRLSRLPFLEFTDGDRWKDLPEKIKAHLEFIRKLIKLPLAKEEWLDLLVPENFVPKKFKMKTNALKGTDPLVSVCIATYRDQEWLRFTIDSILKNAGYENFEIVIILQREPENETDSTGRFFQEKPYLSHPKIKVLKFDQPLGCERAKRHGVELASGELVISLDAHVIPCKNFMRTTVDLFLEYSEVSILGYGIIDAHEDQTIHGYFFNEIPYLLHGLFGLKVLRDSPETMIAYKPGLFIRQSIMGASFCFTRRLYEEVGGYLLNDRTWGDKAFGISAYLYGYQLFGSPDLACVHRGHLRSLHHPNPWKEVFKMTEEGYALEECTLSSLIAGYFYFSDKYFQEYYVPVIKQYAGDSFELQWEEFQSLLPSLSRRKTLFWENAVRTMREYWLEYGDFIWARLDDNKRRYCPFLGH